METRKEQYIADELGYIVAWTVGMTEDEIKEHLEQYPEHKIKYATFGVID